jgi:hypothetical protein
MAIDTRDKRASAIRMPLPTPDGDINSGDRQQATWNYRGIAVQVVVESPYIRRGATASDENIRRGPAAADERIRRP